MGRLKAKSGTASGDLAAKINGLTKWHFIGTEYPPDFTTETERLAFDEAKERYHAARYAERTAMLGERLTTWPVAMWGEIFSERPALEDELTAEQRERWEAYQRERAAPKVETDTGTPRTLLHMPRRVQ